MRCSRGALVLIVLGACSPSGAAPHSPPLAVEPVPAPNVIWILADDLGWMDLACQGNTRIATPNLDRLAAEGMRFTNAYAAAPVCSPTRAAMMTGQSPARVGLTNHLPESETYAPPTSRLVAAEMLDHLPLERVTIAERLRASGYTTAFMGKWHLQRQVAAGGRGSRSYVPERQGFESNLGGCAFGGPPTFFDPYGIHNLPPRRIGEYLPYRLADEAVAFLRERGDAPFFLCLWHYAVHWPIEAPEALIAKYAGREGEGLADPVYGAMVEALDRAVGRVLAELDASGLAERTLVVFTSDNGGWMEASDNRPLRGGKGYLFEGGIRVPMIVRWPGVVEPGSVCETPVVSMDHFPTALEAVGIEPDAAVPLDGESLVPLLRGTGGLERDGIFFHYPNYAWHGRNRLGGAVREGRFKLIERYDDGSLELYDLEEDPGETEDLSGSRPELAARLRGDLARWLSETGARMPRARD
ncbi:MAG: sulfatase [Planctomycetota bacterium]|nr:sulfatase [Planctomycetota bacterium]